MSQFTHNVHKYVLIHCAAEEIKVHVDELKVCSNKDVEFHMLHIEKAAMFIQFVEDLCIIQNIPPYDDYTIKSIWEHVNDPKSVYEFMDLSSYEMQAMKHKIDSYQQKINGKFLNVTSPF
jgi:hypothetical protein